MGENTQTSETTATVAVTVQRNKATPLFMSPETYTATIMENVGSGIEVTRIEVRDDDVVEPFNQVDLRVIGDDGASSFFDVIDNVRVIIRPSVNLESDRETDYTLRIEAKDRGTPPKSSTATVQITVIRNLIAPRFLTDNERVSIPDNAAPGTFVAKMEAEDLDREAPNNEIEFEIDPEGEARTYFYINPESGEITVLKSILETSVNLYRIKVIAKDKGRAE